MHNGQMYKVADKYLHDAKNEFDLAFAKLNKASTKEEIDKACILMCAAEIKISDALKWQKVVNRPEKKTPIKNLASRIKQMVSLFTF